MTGYIPITSICPQVTELIEKFEQEESEEEEEEEEEEESDSEETKSATFKSKTEKEFPDLFKIFKLGSWLKAKITTSHEDYKNKRELN